MTNEDAKKSIVFSFLDEIMCLWRQDFADIERNALAFSLNEKFSPVLCIKMVRYTYNLDFVNLYFQLHSF